MKRSRIAFVPSSSAIENQWLRQATAAAIAAAREVVGGTIPPATPIGRLGDREWGYVAAAIIFGWIQTRAQQASAEGHDIEQRIRATNIDPDPWDSGPIIAILPELAEACGDLDWSLPIGKWPKEIMAKFLIQAMKLIKPAIDARVLSARGVTQKATLKEIADDIPF
jgi:hypothetical protein